MAGREGRQAPGSVRTEVTILHHRYSKGISAFPLGGNPGPRQRLMPCSLKEQLSGASTKSRQKARARSLCQQIPLPHDPCQPRGGVPSAAPAGHRGQPLSHGRTPAPPQAKGEGGPVQARLLLRLGASQPQPAKPTLSQGRRVDARGCSSSLLERRAKVSTPGSAGTVQTTHTPSALTAPPPSPGTAPQVQISRCYHEDQAG